MPLLLAHTARQTTLVGSGRGFVFWHARIWVQRGGLSRNKVSVGEPADGSPPKIEGWLPSAKLNFECHTPTSCFILMANTYHNVSTSWRLELRNGTIFLGYSSCHTWSRNHEL